MSILEIDRDEKWQIDELLGGNVFGRDLSRHDDV